MNRLLESNAAITADYRIIRRNGAVVAFDPVKVAHAMKRIANAVAGERITASKADKNSVDSDSSSAGDGTSTPSDCTSGGGDDGDGGDGDGDGPRRRSNKRPSRKPRSSCSTSASRRKSPPSLFPSAPSDRALLAFVYLITLCVGSALLLTFTDHAEQAEKMLYSIGSAALLAYRMLKPK
jgi:hypothetical protein